MGLSLPLSRLCGKIYNHLKIKRSVIAQIKFQLVLYHVLTCPGFEGRHDPVDATSTALVMS